MTEVCAPFLENQADGSKSVSEYWEFQGFTAHCVPPSEHTCTQSLILSFTLCSLLNFHIYLIVLSIVAYASPHPWRRQQ